MKVVGLVSGGKDSCYAMMKCMQYGHQIVALANLLPMDDSIDELDSFMYQTVGHQIVVGYAECMGLPLFRRRIHGSTRHQKLSYQTTLGDEVEDMLILLSEVKRQIPSVMAVSSGALASDYQRLRVESVCSRLGLVSLAYLWKQDQSLLLQEMISNGISAIMVKVAAIGLDPAKHLGKEISYLQSHLHQLKELYGINVCGEGGEYETLTLDCPLFTNARIVLDDFEVVLHSPDEIASVGVLHPSAFHLEHKKEIASFSNNSLNNVSNEMGSVSEVQGDFILTNKDKRGPLVLASDLVVGAEAEVHISKTKHKNAISMGCWIHDPCEASDGLQKDLAILLKRIESELTKDGYGWVNVLYVHLYIADMNEFALANETYVTFITEEKCHLGVPSRSTIEIPLSQVGLGKAYIEVLIADDQSKQVLHVQSISCWAPSCIGPYSQATLHKEVLYMAGQLGLDPPTMKLCCGGVTAELDQALENCEAVTRSFKCSLASSTVLFVVYCSAALTCPQKLEIQDKFEAFLEQRQVSDLVNRDMSKSFEPIFLYVLAPDLPKSALVEVKPILFVPEDTEIEFEDTDEDTETEIASDTQDSLCTTFPSSWNFENVPCGSSCLQKYIIQNKICVVTLSVMSQQAAKICFDSSVSDPAHVDHKYFATEKHMKQVARFCIYLLDKTLMENYFSWGDVMSLRFYYSTSLEMPLEMLSLVLIDVFNEFAEMSKKISSGTEPMFNLIPVLGAGKSASSMDDLITCELFSSKANNC